MIGQELGAKIVFQEYLSFPLKYGSIAINVVLIEVDSHAWWDHGTFVLKGRVDNNGEDIVLHEDTEVLENVGHGASFFVRKAIELIDRYIEIYKPVNYEPTPPTAIDNSDVPF